MNRLYCGKPFFIDKFHQGCLNGMLGAGNAPVNSCFWPHGYFSIFGLGKLYRKFHVLFNSLWTNGMANFGYIDEGGAWLLKSTEPRRKARFDLRMQK